MRTRLMAATAAAVLAMGGIALAQAGGDAGAAPGDHAAPKADRADGQKAPAPAERKGGEATGSPRRLQNTGMNAGGDTRMNERTDDRSNTRDTNGMAGDRDRMRTTTTTNARVRGTTTRITEVQRTRIKEVFRGRPGPRLTHVTFRIGVGARVPRNVRIVAVPPEIVSIYPEWQGYSYFETPDQIVIIDPMSFAVVGVLPL